MAYGFRPRNENKKDFDELRDLLEKRGIDYSTFWNGLIFPLLQTLREQPTNPRRIYKFNLGIIRFFPWNLSSTRKQ